MKTYRVYDHDSGEDVEVESTSPEEAAKERLASVDDGYEGGDISVCNDRGEWMRYELKIYRETRYEIVDQREIDDPTDDPTDDSDDEAAS